MATPDLGWYPAVPCCPHCYSSASRRSEHPSGVCVTCLRKLSPQRKRLLEPIPDLLTQESWSFFQRDPERWLAFAVGKSHVPPIARHLEARRVMHLACARFWNEADSPLGYELFAPEDIESRVWEHGPDFSLDTDAQQASCDSVEMRASRERHNLHVRIWRNKFNGRIARPLLQWLHQLGLPTSDGKPPTIARTARTTAGGGWVVDLILDAWDPGNGPTRWVLVLSNEEEDKSISMLGVGITPPTHISWECRGHLGPVLEYSRALLLSYVGLAD